MIRKPTFSPSVILILFAALACGLAQAGPVQTVALGAPNADLLVYTDALSADWQNWSWGTTIDLSNPSPVHGGSASIRATYPEAWAGVYLHANQPLAGVDYPELRFWIHGGSAGGQKIAVKIIDDSNGNWDQLVQVTPQANTWTQVSVPLAQVGNPATIGGIVWQEYNGGAQPTFYLDDVTLVARAGPPPPTPTPSGGPALSVDVLADRALSAHTSTG